MNRTVLAIIVLAVIVAIAAYLFYDGTEGGSETTGDQTITTPAPADPAAPPAAPATP